MTPIIHTAAVHLHALYPIVGSFFGVFLTGFSKSSSSAEQSTTQEQVAGEGGASGSVNNVVGAAADLTQGGGVDVRGTTLGKGASVNVVTSDPEVTQAALEAGVVTSQNAIAGEASTAGNALQSNTDVDVASLDAMAAVAGGSDAVALGAIQAGTSDVTNSDNFGTAALQAAQDAQDTATTALETESAEYAAGLSEDTANAQISANNALSGAQQPVSQGDLPTEAQEQGTSTLQKWSTWIAIIGGVLAIAWYLKGRKSA